MKNLPSTELAKRLKNFVFIIRVWAILAGIGAAGYLIELLAEVTGGNSDLNTLQPISAHMVDAICASAALVVLSKIMKNIHQTGKPFTKENVYEFLHMGCLLTVGVGFSFLSDIALDLFCPTYAGHSLPFEDLMLLCFILFIVIVREIFRYGTALEEEMDMIA